MSCLCVAGLCEPRWYGFLTSCHSAKEILHAGNNSWDVSNTLVKLYLLFDSMDSTEEKAIYLSDIPFASTRIHHHFSRKTTTGEHWPPPKNVATSSPVPLRYPYTLWVVWSSCVFQYAVAIWKLFGPIEHLFCEQFLYLNPLPFQFCNSLGHAGYSGSLVDILVNDEWMTLSLFGRPILSDHVPVP